MSAAQSIPFQLSVGGVYITAGNKKAVIVRTKISPWGGGTIYVGAVDGDPVERGWDSSGRHVKGIADLTIVGTWNTGTPSKLQLEVGKKYQTMDGEVVEMTVDRWGALDGRIVGGSKHGALAIWQSDGICPGVPNWNIVGEYRTRAKDPTSVSLGARFVVPTQGRHKCRCDSRDLFHFGCSCNGI